MSLEENDCPICLEKINDKHTIILPKCDHVLHSSCLFQYIEKTPSDVKCPLCRQHLLHKQEQVLRLEIESPPDNILVPHDNTVYIDRMKIVFCIYTAAICFIVWIYVNTQQQQQNSSIETEYLNGP